jgi:hypothetical protein
MQVFVLPNSETRKRGKMKSVEQTLKVIGDHLRRPSITFKPELRAIRDSDSAVIGWIAIYHQLSAKGKSPDEAMVNFDKAWFVKEAK